MSAPNDAKSLGDDGWKQPLLEVKACRIRCDCGWRGNLTELLAIDDDETLWCPQCTTAAWAFE